MTDPTYKTTDICIIGSGIVGLSLAYQLFKHQPGLSISIIDKESKIGCHSSGRNSGVLHAGIYYDPNSIKAKVSVAGAKRLKEWCEQEDLPVLKCGKVITPQRVELDSQLDVLFERGKMNGATVELIDEKQFHELVPDGRTASGRALWSPDTCVVKPILVIQKLRERLLQQGVEFIFSEEKWKAFPDKKCIVLSNGSKLSYGHLYNCAGLQADRIAHKYGVGKSYTILPFRGNYWQLKEGAPFNFETNLYPVPDLEIPFLGVHATPSVDGAVYFGPTATPALGRENYRGMDKLEVGMALRFLHHMIHQFARDKIIRRYANEQAFQWLPQNFLKATQAIVPKLQLDHIKFSDKVGIRPQLYDKKNYQLVQDFLTLEGPSSTHIINAISPAFTASFAFADFILGKNPEGVS